jgi:hypothetical protein
MGIALVSVDGGATKEVDLFAHPTDEIHTPIVTISDLSRGQHTLTIQATGRQNVQALGNVVVVDAVDVQPGTTVSHWQDTNPDVSYTGNWTKSSNNFNWSGSGVSNLPELPVTAHESQAAGDKVTLPFRGTAISLIGYLGPDAGIASIQIDSAAAQDVDMYSPVAKYQPSCSRRRDSPMRNHTLDDHFDGPEECPIERCPGRRRCVRRDHARKTLRGLRSVDHYVGNWTRDNEARVWSEGQTATSNIPGTTATFSFTGTSVSWIGCEKGSAGGVADVSIDGVFQKTVKLNQSYPVEGYQMTVFRADGLTNGPHKLEVKVTNTDGSYVVVDAFDTHP